MYTDSQESIHGVIGANGLLGFSVGVSDFLCQFARSEVKILLDNFLFTQSWSEPLNRKSIN